MSILALLAVLAVGTAGYMVIEREYDPTLLDAAYMTVITVSTVVYGELWPPTPAGRAWTIGVIVFGIGTVSVAFTSLITLFVGGEFRSVRERRKMVSTIQHLRGHTILCGYGRMGALAAKEVADRGVSLVVIESDARKEESLQDLQIPYVIGDATVDTVLREAGIMEAKTLVAILPHDADNVYITLTAYTLRPDLHIVARAEQPSTEAKLKRAGASRVVCTQIMGATRIANILTRPTVVDLVEMANKGVELEIDEYIVGTRSPLVGRSLRESAVRKKTGASVVAIKQADGKTLFNPDPDAVVGAGDTLVLVGPAGVSSLLDGL